MKTTRIIQWLSLSCFTLTVATALADTTTTTTTDTTTTSTTTTTTTTTTTNPPPPKWTGDISAGVTLTRGNSQTTLASFTANADRKSDVNEWQFGANATYGKARVVVNNPTPTTINTTTAQSADAFAQYNQFFTPRFYGYLRVEGMHDDVADIHYRVTVGPGVGYYFIKEKTMDLSGEVGPGFISERLGSQQLNYAIARISEKFHYQMSDRSRVWETVEVDPDVEWIRNYIVNSEFGIAADLNKSKTLELQCYLDDTYNNYPTPGRKCNDLKLVAAIDYKF